MARIGFLVRTDLLDAGHFQESSVDATWSLFSMGKVVSNSGRGSAADPDTTGECISGVFILRLLLVVVDYKMLISTFEVEFEFVQIFTLVMDGRRGAKCAASSVDRIVTTA